VFSIIERVIFFVAIVMFSAVLGFLISQYQVFPYALMMDSKVLLDDLVQRL
jgi:hypothetical protein